MLVGNLPGNFSREPCEGMGTKKGATDHGCNKGHPSMLWLPNKVFEF